MKKFSQEEFDNFEIIHGIKMCPSGDYSSISSFGESCRFGEWCRFGESCRFGEWCSFGESCRFGQSCRFGESCSFGEWCRFGQSCSFGQSCRFGESCSFGQSCSFGESCRFGQSCRFGESCSFENGYTSINNIPFIIFSGLGRRTNSMTYIYNFKEIMVRCGCFFGTVEEFKKRVVEKNGDEFYLSFVDLSVEKIKTLQK